MKVNFLKFHSSVPKTARDYAFYDYFVNLSSSSDDDGNYEVGFYEPSMLSVVEGKNGCVNTARTGFLDHDLVKKMIDDHPLEYLRAKMACLRYAIKTWPDEFHLALRHGCNDVYQEMIKRGYEAETLREIADLTAEIPNFASVKEWLKVEPLCLEAEEVPLEQWAAKFDGVTFQVASSKTGNLVIGKLSISPEVTAVKAVLYGADKQQPEFPTLTDMGKVRFGHYFELDNRGTQWGVGLRENQGYGHEGCYPPEGALWLNAVANTNNWHCDWVFPSPFPEELFDFSSTLKLIRPYGTFVLPEDKAVRANGWEQ